MPTDCRASGIAVEVELVEGTFHDFDAVVPSASVSKSFFEAQMTALERAFIG
jgi:hypothetical protein